MKIDEVSQLEVYNQGRGYANYIWVLKSHGEEDFSNRGLGMSKKKVGREKHPKIKIRILRPEIPSKRAILEKKNKEERI